MTKLITSSGSFQLTSIKEEKYFYAFDKCFRQFLDKALHKTGKYVKELISKLLVTENIIEKLQLVRFLLLLLFSQIVEKLLALFGPYRIISALTYYEIN